eukprot:m.19917 g.19917  ORF g.19917 m.19917 type:complete len:291 (-) comp8099_c0_seq1:180-1052(-)
MANIQNRLGEFRRTVESLHAQKGILAMPSSTPTVKSRLFSTACKISERIDEVQDKCAKLQELAEETGLYDNNARDIQALSDVIKDDINAISRAIQELSDHIKRNQAAQGKHTQKHNKGILESLRIRLQRASGKFKRTLQMRTEKLVSSRKRLKEYAGAGFQTQDTGFERFAAASGAADHTVVDMQQDMQMSMYHEQADSYVQDRASAVENIQSTIEELGEVFTQLATMIQDQGQKLDRIDTTMEEVDMNVEAAHSELTKYFNSLKSNRSLMLKVFGVLLVFFIVFVAILA